MTARWEPQPTISPWTAGLAILETALVSLVVLLGLFSGLSTFTGDHDGLWTGAFWGVANLLAVALVVAGALTAGSSPRRGTALLAIGAVGMAGLWYWVWIVSVPFAAVLIAVAVVRTVTQDRSQLNLYSKGVKS